MIADERSRDVVERDKHVPRSAFSFPRPPTQNTSSSFLLFSAAFCCTPAAALVWALDVVLDVQLTLDIDLVDLPDVDARTIPSNHLEP